MPNDRLREDASRLSAPEITIIRNGSSLYKPGMKTVFVAADGESQINGAKALVGGSFCTCNTVCSCQADCSCHSYDAPGCSCHTYQANCSAFSRNPRCGFCSCVPVH